MTRSDFAVFILTHGRPDRVITYATLRKQGYTGPIWIVIDDEDKTAQQYRERFGDAVLTFSKAEIAATFDEGDNFGDRRAIVYARNACFDLARKVGARWFVQFDDDYLRLQYRRDAELRYTTIAVQNADAMFDALIEYAESTNLSALCMSQGGDHIGGAPSSYNKHGVIARRKAMNTFLCSTDRPLQFYGRINEDVNLYTCGQRRGEVVFLTLMQAMIVQKQTQSNAGGMTGLYLDSGTYLKSFYSVMYAPSCVRIGVMGEAAVRLHHDISWPHTAPKIVRESVRKVAS